MLPGLTELLMAAQLTLATPATTPPTVGQPATQPPVASESLKPISVAKLNCKYVDGCCKPDSCTCNGFSEEFLNASAKDFLPSGLQLHSQPQIRFDRAWTDTIHQGRWEEKGVSGMDADYKLSCYHVVTRPIADEREGGGCGGSSSPRGRPHRSFSTTRSGTGPRRPLRAASRGRPRRAGPG